MALLHSFEKSGNLLFRYRGQIPILLFVAAVPVVYFTGNAGLSERWQVAITLIGLLSSLLGFIIRAYTIATTPAGTSGRNTDKQVADVLNTSGIYSMIRHPLYLGNFLMWSGIVLFTFNIWFFLVVSLAYWLYYERIMFAEERFLEQKYGEEYLNWSLSAPAFIPAFKKFRKSQVPFSFKSILRREYSGILATVTGFAFIDHLRHFFLFKSFDPWRTSTWCFIASVVFALLFRTLKHHTKLLSESDRS
jgi:protein-S-isoprenylcysteine O-methyltransferase Ste14